MTNTMPMLTDSERRLQIALLTSWDESPNITMHTRELIALAALKAEPVYQFIVNNPDHDGYIEWADCNPDFYSKEPPDRRRILYTAPTVPEVKNTDIDFIFLECCLSDYLNRVKSGEIRHGCNDSQHLENQIVLLKENFINA